MAVRTSKAKRIKAAYIGAPAHFALEEACKNLWTAFCGDGGGIYVVGSVVHQFEDIELDELEGVISSNDEKLTLRQSWRLRQWTG